MPPASEYILPALGPVAAFFVAGVLGLGAVRPQALPARLGARGLYGLMTSSLPNDASIRVSLFLGGATAMVLAVLVSLAGVHAAWLALEDGGWLRLLISVSPLPLMAWWLLFLLAALLASGAKPSH